MRVLHLVSYFPPDRIGGVGEVVSLLHRGLRDRGVDSQVLTSGSTRGEPEVTRIGRSPASFPIRTLTKASFAGAFDIIHAQHGEALPLLLLLRLRRRRPRLLLTIHVSNRHIGKAFRPFTSDGHLHSSGIAGARQRFIQAPIKHLFDRAAVALADEVSFISQSAARDTLGAGTDAKVIYNAVTETSARVNEIEPADLLYVGSHSHRKRTALLPEILAAVRSRHPGATLRIIGFELDDAPAVRDGFDRRGLLEAVTCEGKLRSGDIAPFYAAATALVVPSAYEGLPMVILEAAMAGTPCVATAVGGADEFIDDGVNGFLVPLDEPAAMAAACSRLLADAESAEEVGRAAANAVADRFGLERQLNEYLSMYQLLLAKSPA